MPLNLHSRTTAKIFVKMIQHSGNDTWQPQFRLEDSDDWHTAPIHWHPAKDSTTSLSITFVLEENVSKLKAPSDSTLTLGDVDDGKQTGTVTVAAARDHFTIVRPDGGTHDPQIVVTPMT